MRQYSDIILYGDETSSEARKLLAEYLQRHGSLKVRLSFFDMKDDSTSKNERAIAYGELQKALFFCKRKRIPLLFVSVKEMINDIRFFQSAGGEPCRFQMYRFPVVLQGEPASDKGSCAI